MSFSSVTVFFPCYAKCFTKKVFRTETLFLPKFAKSFTGQGLTVFRNGSF